MKSRITLLAPLTVISLALAGCAATPTSTATSPAPTSSTGVTMSAQYNESDIDFLTDMIPHHTQALWMVGMTEGRDLTPEFAQLTQDIQAAQGPEIDQMSGWLGSWGYDVPDSGSHMGMMSDENGMGMMTDEDTETLGAMMGGDFEDLWMSMMIKHHEGAVAMSRIELAEGVSTEARNLAQQIIDAQQAEIALMEELLADEG